MNFIGQVVLVLFILNLGVALGAGLYEAKLIMPLWFPKSTESGYRVSTQGMNEVDSGRKFWAFVTTGPLTLLTLANLLLVCQVKPSGYEWWLAAALIALIERISTFSFFIPTVIRLQRADQLSPQRINRLVARWIGFNYVRNLFTLLAFGTALVAFASII